MKLRLIFLSIVLSSCAQLDSALTKYKTDESKASTPQASYARKVEYQLDVNSSASNSYKKTHVWIAKRLINSKFAIQVQDEKDFRIVSKMATSCNTYNSSIEMNFDFMAKDKKVKIIFENIYAKEDSSNVFSGMFGTYPKDQGQLDDFKLKCLEPMIEDLKKAIAQNNDW